MKDPERSHQKLDILKNRFGYDSFRSGQEEVIDEILAGRDVLAVMPSGAGKSLCYQIPAMLMEGLTVVISPLISLMKDQVNALNQAALPAACINSSLSPREQGETMEAAVRGEYKILYIAPERLCRNDIRELSGAADISMITVDEAHCVSQWGHDFRPSYLDIALFIKSLKKRPVVAAFTATATKQVKEDILRLLKLRDPHILGTGFDRPNLYFGVLRRKDKAAALRELLETRRDQSGIIYCSTRKNTEEVFAALGAAGFPVTRYHAGLDDSERHRNQDDFLYDRKTIMAATNAFGMGIDKSNVSFVIHYNMPKNIESYYQEAGRAGRDGSPADCILLYSGQDVQIQKYLILNSRDNDEEETISQDMIDRNLELLKQMTFYATGSDCLRASMLRYFGEQPPAYCGNCSNCLGGTEKTDISLEARKIISCVYRLKQRGRSFGKTMVINILRGSREKKLLEFRLDSLSTYGIMKDTKPEKIRRILDYLIDDGYLALEGAEFPVVTGTEKSGEIIFEKRPLEMMLPRDEPERAAPSKAAPAGNGTPPEARPSVPGGREFDEELFLALKQLRNDIARREKLPAYIVFNDASLRDMCLRRPKSPEEFLGVSGVGKVKMEKYGPAFTELIRGYGDRTQ